MSGCAFLPLSHVLLPGRHHAASQRQDRCWCGARERPWRQILSLNSVGLSFHAGAKRPSQPAVAADDPSCAFHVGVDLYFCVLADDPRPVPFLSRLRRLRAGGPALRPQGPGRRQLYAWSTNREAGRGQRHIRSSFPCTCADLEPDADDEPAADNGECAGWASFPTFAFSRGVTLDLETVAVPIRPRANVAADDNCACGEKGFRGRSVCELRRDGSLCFGGGPQTWSRSPPSKRLPPPANVRRFLPFVGQSPFSSTTMPVQFMCLPASPRSLPATNVQSWDYFCARGG